jgi:molecular chaperone GrpE
MGDPADASSPAPADEGKPPAVPGSEVGEDWATRYKYLLADFDNYRKRTERERESAQTRIRGSFLRGLLPIYEAFERARETVAGAREGTDALRRGLDLLEVEWRRLLQEEGVEPVARVGQPFAPDEQEAVAESRAAGELPEGAVAEIVQQGYRFRGGLLRPAKVVVARAAPPPAEEESPPDAEPPTSGEEQ